MNHQKNGVKTIQYSNVNNYSGIQVDIYQTNGHMNNFLETNINNASEKFMQQQKVKYYFCLYTRQCLINS